MKKRGILAFLCAVALLATGCDSIKGTINDTLSDTMDTASSAVSEASESLVESVTDTRQAEVEKHNAYIDLYNTLINDVDKVVEDYADEFGFDVEIYIEDGFGGFSMYSNSIADDLADAMEYTDKEPAEAAADAALKDMEPLLSAYAAALDGAQKYYDDKNYVDDDFAKAQGYHDVIYGQYNAVWDKIEAFMSAVDVMLEGQDDEQLAIYEADGDMIHYYCLKAVITGQAMTSYLYQNEITAGNILDINIAEFRPLYDDFAAVYAAYDELVGGNSDAGRDEGITTLSTFNSTMSDVKSNAAELVSRVQNGKEFSSTDLSIAKMKDGTPESLSASVSSLLSNYNSWIVR